MLRLIKLLGRLSPYLVLAISLAGTAGTCFYAFQVDRLAGEGRFREKADQLRYQIGAETQFYSSILMQTRSFFQIVPGLTRERFLAYVEDAGFLRNQRALVGVGYVAHTEGGFRVQYFSSEGALPVPSTYDPSSERSRREAMNSARDSGLAALTGRVNPPIELSPNDVLVMYVAVYHRGWPVDTVEQRRAALAGFVFSPIRIPELFAEIERRKPTLSRDVEFSFYDRAAAGTSPHLVYDSETHHRHHSRFDYASPLDLGGRTWEVHFRSSPRFDRELSRGMPWAVLIFGLLGSGLVFFLLRLNQSGQQAVEKSEEQLRLISDALPDLIAYIDPQYRFRFNNRAYEEWFGKPRAEMEGRLISELFPPDSYDEIRRCVERAFGGKTCRYTGTSESVKKGRRIVDALMIPDRRGDGSVAGVVTLMSDVTERRLAQEQLLEEVRVTEAFNRVGARLAGRLDIRQLLQDVADIGTEITGAEVGAIFYATSPGGESPADLSYAAAAREPRFLEKVGSEIQWTMSALRRESLVRLSRPGEAREALAADHPFRVLFGSTLEVKSYLAVPMISRVGQVVGLIAFGHRQSGVFDERAERFAEGLAAQAALALGSARLYAELEQAIRAKDRSLRELARSNSELQQFAYIASHDLKEPLRMVTSYVRLIERRFRALMDEDGREYVRFAVDGATRMQALINALLLYSRVGTEGAPLVPSSTEAAVKAALANLRPAIEESRAQVIAHDLPLVSGDLTQLTQLFQNLIGNAIKYRREEPPRIEIYAAHQDNRWRFAVRDNGIGIDPQFSERVFVIFQRLHPREKYPGTGIGLAICKKIVERHGGEIHVESAPGQGSTFYFTLPEAPAAALPAPGTQAPATEVPAVSA